MLNLCIPLGVSSAVIIRGEFRWMLLSSGELKATQSQSWKSMPGRRTGSTSGGQDETVRRRLVWMINPTMELQASWWQARGHLLLVRLLRGYWFQTSTFLMSVICCFLFNYFLLFSLTASQVEWEVVVILFGFLTDVGFLKVDWSD